MTNIKFCYLYRDSGNYKTHSYAVFANTENISLKEIEKNIRAKLIDDQYFYAREWNLPDLFPTTFNPYDDPTWHEYDCIEFTDEPATPQINRTKVIQI